MVNTKTLYNCLHKGILGISTFDLPLVLRYAIRKRKTLKYKRKLVRSIDKQDASIDIRDEFGHWEIDTVRGVKNAQDEALVALLERKTRYYVALRSPSANAKDLVKTLLAWLKKISYNTKPSTICKTISSDNGLEFSELARLETLDIKLYYAHPYSSLERCSNESHNGLLLRMIRKGDPIKTLATNYFSRTSCGAIIFQEKS